MICHVPCHVSVTSSLRAQEKPSTAAGWQTSRQANLFYFPASGDVGQRDAHGHAQHPPPFACFCPSFVCLSVPWPSLRAGREEKKAQTSERHLASPLRSLCPGWLGKERRYGWVLLGWGGTGTDFDSFASFFPCNLNRFAAPGGQTVPLPPLIHPSTVRKSATIHWE